MMWRPSVDGAAATITRPSVHARPRGVLTFPVMSSDRSLAVPPDDLRLEHFLDRVLNLSQTQRSSGPDAFLAEVDVLRAELTSLQQSHSEEVLRGSFEAFAQHRFELVDSGEEYATAAEEILVLSMVAAEAPTLCIRALQQGVVALSSVLAEEGVVEQFGKLLRRLRQVARQTRDAELQAWLAGVAAALPA